MEAVGILVHLGIKPWFCVSGSATAASRPVLAVLPIGGKVNRRRSQPRVARSAIGRSVAPVEIASPVIVACAAFAVGGIWLIWQIISWRRSGPRSEAAQLRLLPHLTGRGLVAPIVVVEVRQGFPVFDGDRLSDPQTQVTARNRGRKAVIVTGWAFRLPNGDNAFFREPLPWSAPLPHRLEPHSDVSWFVATDVIKNVAAENAVAYQSLRPYVTLASGRPVYAKRRGIGL
jgi:hypothetical protein